MLDYNASVLVIYTGGTIGMIEDPETGTLKAYDFSHLKEYVPELSRLKFNINSIQFQQPIDSSDMNPEQWKKIVWIIEDNYDRYDGFVILHGTDTMAYSASALSFMLENIGKPVILTGSQLPIGKIRTDGKENLITALEIAVDKDPDGKAFVTEVCIFFQSLLMRGNRTTKINATYFKAFNSFNYPILAEAGTHIHYRHELMHRPLRNSKPKFHASLDPNVTIIKLFPGISAEILKATIAIPHLKAIVLETYGAGNSPNEKWFLNIIAEAVNKGIVVVNVTQCASGSVDMMRYESGKALKDIGVVSGYDITTEAAVAKLMFLFGLGLDHKEVKTYMKVSIAGEATVE
ncbi:L-asparaginase 1 [Bacteroidia bacterium]|nr:L-asparaginase 1 [Bacteroidia bacterium]GHT05442.1 L-asparaginase 1 [Bacteroidia bacterium]GHT51170.1 L-asparaginase 1 [Bacteroidia bacterium]